MASKAPSYITLDVQGVGYEVFIPLSTYYVLPDLNESVSLVIHTQLKDDSIQLFGFFTAEEKGAYMLLTGVSGIGPKLALSVLSTMSVSDLRAAIEIEDLEKIHAVPGVGKKSAGRIVLELKDKMNWLPSSSKNERSRPSPNSSQVMDEALSALINLGYRPQDGKKVLKHLSGKTEETWNLKDLIREALKELARG